MKLQYNIALLADKIRRGTTERAKTHTKKTAVPKQWQLRHVQALLTGNVRLQTLPTPAGYGKATHDDTTTPQHQTPSLTPPINGHHNTPTRR